MTIDMENQLFNCKNVSEFLTMFMGLSMKNKLSIFTNEVEIRKGTPLFRIRRTGGITDPHNPKEWEPTPKKYATKGRFNEKGGSVLYVASAPDFLEREVRLKEGEEYYLAKYVCNRSFKVGSFLGEDSQVNTLIHKIAMSVNGTEGLTENELRLMDQYYEKVKKKSLVDISVDKLASLYLYRMIPDLYEATNKLGKLVLKMNDNGIRYSSVYAPIELSGFTYVITLNGIEEGNYVLTQKGYENIEFVSVEEKIGKKTQELDLLIKEFSNCVNAVV